MAPFKGSISQREVQWVKLSNSCTYNKICYFRRTRSLVNLAHGIHIIGQFLMISAKNRYDDLQDKTIPKFLDARIDTNNLLSSLTFGMCACTFLNVFFCLLMICDWFWPERKENLCIQWTWKLGSALEVQIHGVSADEQESIRSTWDWIALAYRKDGRTVAGLVFYWLGPFADHARKDRAKTQIKEGLKLDSTPVR
ncbi:hypothetical protein AtubIFM55763_006548 [Aspergillus tubingensis]|uniref:Uncharacterized protein n=1 Tax=Aspergillus tubingensis TaxID=5068 RepID=A0A9W6AB31_ASPTU|nr:hypothetical protein AtubIFM55763_006548 [Aspergillus tubingensis]GLA79255.1 hypothetical protein AtubIFM56815_000042 [Aspergillus tubingensis]GLB16128.1 hypothetical protein AtubIFM61612_005965 [Aspergillus tubingensis]